ncbi:sensor histidine kinase [Clostridium estertheticum]|uniref:sensor histidine kinase n=1 Tax=Clostridium estertheticum TaxID=238834 RepID=UPI001C7D5050|nr:sensor histidine kinase [Clostridium estertheticum]WLC72597.1 sensor histidine kinase [Clostridium estertheticum]
MLDKSTRIQSISFEANGIGISEDDFPKIFSRFYRGRNIKDAEGIGIGLYLSREIIMLHGGYIKVSSNKEGSKFSMFLPISL